MASVETHTQFFGSHNDPEAQGNSGWEHLCKCFTSLGTRMKEIFVLKHTHITWYHSFLSHVICCGSSYDGVQRPLGEAFTWSVIDEGYHDYCLVHPRWGQLHQLTDIQINIRRMCLFMCSAKQSLLAVIHLQICCVYLSWCGKSDLLDKYYKTLDDAAAGCVGGTKECIAWPCFQHTAAWLTVLLTSV